jgi:peroxiredoxin
MFVLSTTMNSLAITSYAGRVEFADQKPPVKIYSSLEEVPAATTESVLLIFFSLVCHVCWDELFEMKEFVEKFSLPVLLIGVSADEPDELKSFASRYSLDSPIIYDGNKLLYRRFKVRMEPYRVILVKNQPVYADDYSLDYLMRRDRAKQCLLQIASR